jgi:hypothetical protein
MRIGFPSGCTSRTLAGPVEDWDRSPPDPDDPYPQNLGVTRYDDSGGWIVVIVPIELREGG